MQTPSKDSIKDNEGKFYIVRKESYRSRTTPDVEWIVCEKLEPTIWRMERTFKRLGDAKEWLYICAKV